MPPAPRSRPQPLSRRRFLAGASGAAVGLGLAACAPQPAPLRVTRRGTIVGAGRFLDTDTNQLHHQLCLFDLDQPSARAFDLDFFGHGLAVHPLDRRRAALFEKKGPGACELDLVAGVVVRPITTSPGRAFYGHGAWSADGALLYATETELATREGLVNVRDGDSLRELGRFPTGGRSPHDCLLTDAGATLVVTNGGGPATGDPADAPGVSYVDVASERVLERVRFETPRINAGHLALSARGDLVAISAPREGLPPTALGGVTIRLAGGEARTLSEPEAVVGRMVGESLSLVIDDERRRVGVTNPDGDIVTFWALDDGRLVKSLELPGPRGLARTLDGEQLVLSHGQGALSLLDPATLDLYRGGGVRESPLAGSHIFTWDPPA